MDPAAEELGNGCGVDSADTSKGSEWTDERVGKENASESADVVEEEEAIHYGDVIGLTWATIMKKRFRTDDAAAVLRDPRHYRRVNRQREHKLETRTNCKATLSIYLDYEGSLSMSDSAKAHIDGMHGHGIPTSKILGYMAGQTCRYCYVGFSPKWRRRAQGKLRRTRKARRLDKKPRSPINPDCAAAHPRRHARATPFLKRKFPLMARPHNPGGASTPPHFLTAKSTKTARSRDEGGAPAP
ncbi:hypothetical protein PIB30_009439 [Stylosanthes scabra]|uniref:Uncharacterized protein n=1 Tax=Stylosanthes scabra TaxID=79078 RepID=A0ABU6X2J4_9FABA|nr:hypothetical protein [Stylosanthes scabra]